MSYMNNIQPLIQLFIVVVAGLLIINFLIPLLPVALGMMALIVIVCALILWLFRWAGLI